MVSASLVEEDNEIIITTNKGQAIRMEGRQISIIGRNTQGVRVLDVPDGEIVTGFAVIKLEKADDQQNGSSEIH